MFKVQFADIGEGLTEGKVIEVLVKVGDTVKAGDPLFSVETDKVNADIPAPIDGKISVIGVKAEQDINVGDVVMEIDDGVSTKASTTVAEVVEENASVVGATPVSNEVIASRVDTTSVQNAVDKTIKSSPLARKIAASRQIDLSTIVGSGPNGRILVADLDQAQSAVKPTTTAQATTTPVVNENINHLPNVDANAPLEWTAIPMNGVRKATVKAMSKSHTEIAAFTGMKNMDITPVYDLRAQLKGFAEKKGIKLTYLAFIVKAAALALKDMPNVNVRGDFENKQILQIHNINIGIAVDTPEGLMVPVIKGAYAMSIFEIATKISELAKKARDRKLTLPEMRDATFTISNFGSVGLDYATPIINSPEASILGIGTMTKTPVFKNDAVVARYIMPFSITSDHRILDGADAARFLNKMQEYLDQPLSLVV